MSYSIASIFVVCVVAFADAECMIGKKSFASAEACGEKIDELINMGGVNIMASVDATDTDIMEQIFAIAEKHYNVQISSPMQVALANGAKAFAETLVSRVVQGHEVGWHVGESVGHVLGGVAGGVAGAASGLAAGGTAGVVASVVGTVAFCHLAPGICVGKAFVDVAAFGVAGTTVVMGGGGAIVGGVKGGSAGAHLVGKVGGTAGAMVGMTLGYALGNLEGIVFKLGPQLLLAVTKSGRYQIVIAPKAELS